MDDQERFDRIIDAVNEAYKEMLERKARLGELVHTDDGTGVMRTQAAIDVYERVYGPLPPLPRPQIRPKPTDNV